jgi:hypothetical protein
MHRYEALENKFERVGGELNKVKVLFGDKFFDIKACKLVGIALLGKNDKMGDQLEKYEKADAGLTTELENARRINRSMSWTRLS